MFTYDKESAKEGSGTTGGKIEAGGDFVGKFQLVKKIVSKKKTIGLQFKFTSDDNKYSSFDLWTHRPDGSELFGGAKVQAMMCVLGLNSVTAQERMVEDYDFDLGKVAEVMREVCPELMGRIVGVVLERENYINGMGEERYRMNLVCPFNAVSKQTANEMMENSPASQLLDIVAGLRVKQAKPYDAGGIPPANINVVTNPNPFNEDKGEDIPF